MVVDRVAGLANSRSQAHEARLQDVGTALLDDIDRRLKGHVETQQQTIGRFLAPNASTRWRSTTTRSAETRTTSATRFAGPNKALDLQLREAKSTLIALNVELHEEDVERGSPIAGSGSFAEAVAAIPRSNGSALLVE